MNRLKIILSACTFMLAVGGAFASKSMVADDGYTSLAAQTIDPKDQTEACQFRKSCDGGTVPCTYHQTAPNIDFQLYKTSTTCATALNQPS